MASYHLEKKVVSICGTNLSYTNLISFFKSVYTQIIPHKAAKNSV